MLIIFDLDDTLVDTSGSIIPVKLKEFLKKACNLGFFKESFFKEKFLQLLEINKKAESTKKAIEQFCFLNNFPKNVLQDLFLKDLYTELDEQINVLELKNASEMLNILHKRYELALVSIGEKSVQLQKMKAAGIDCSLFSVIDIIEVNNKGKSYKKIISDLKKKPESTIVCGDRIDRDLLPAKELGCVTVHMRYGRGLSKNNSKKQEKIVDFEITELKELKDILLK